MRFRYYRTTTLKIIDLFFLILLSFPVLHNDLPFEGHICLVVIFMYIASHSMSPIQIEEQ
jgi:hypothetical protein